MPDVRRAGLLLLCVAGIYGAYITQGVVSEHLQLKRYGAGRERFGRLEALHGAQSLACFVWAYALLLLGRLFSSGDSNGSSGSGKAAAGAGAAKGGSGKAGGGKGGKGGGAASELPHWYEYWRPALTNAVGPALGMVALKNISYPAQVLAKSTKMVPVMVVGTILHRKVYSAFEYACMGAIGAGVGLFARRGSSKVAARLEAPNAPLGYALCAANLFLDGYTNAAQDEINRRHPANSPVHMMAWMNFWCALYYGAYLAVSGVGAELAAFCGRHPDALRDILLFCACGAAGQLFIFFTIKRFGALTNTLICTTRKFFTILFSVVLVGNPLLPAQWGAVALVFGGLIASTLAAGGKKHHQHHHHDAAAAAAGGGGGAGKKAR